MPLPGPAARGPAALSSKNDNARQSQGSAEPRPGEAEVFIVSTRRGKQFNSIVYADVDPINGAPRDAVLMNPDDAAMLHFVQNDRVILKNDVGIFRGRVFLAPIARGNLQIHWPEGNVIIPRGIHDTLGGVPDYNATVRVERSNA